MKRFSRLKPILSHVILIGLSLLAILITIIILWWDITRQPALQNNFSYNADLISSQTYYDPESGRAQTPQYIKTSLELKLKNSNEGAAVGSTITNSLSDDQASVIEDTRLVNPRSGLYVSDNPRNHEHVLAPQAIRDKGSFTYRSPFYNNSMVMDYQGKETINGLPVYRYQAHPNKDTLYNGKLQSLTPVPDKDTLTYDPTLQIWVEPESGWVVKSHSEMTVNLVNKTSGVFDGIYGHIKETMSEESTLQHTAYAKDLKLKAVFARQIVPSVMLLVAFGILFAILIATVRKRTIPVYGAVFAVLFVSGSVLVGWALNIQPLMTFFAGTPAVNPLTALLFTLTAGAITALYKRYHPIAAAIGLVIVSLSIIQLLSALGAVSYAADLLLFKSSIIEVSRTIPSRMSAENAATFLLLGVALIKAGVSSQRSKVHFARFLVGMVLAIGVLGFLLRLTRLDAVLTVQLLAPFSVVPSLLFVICSFTLFQLFRTLNERPATILHTLRGVRWPVLATIPIILITFWAQTAKNTIAQTVGERFSAEISAFEKQLDHKISTYIQALAGAKALYNSSQEVTQQEFHKYVTTYLSRQKEDAADVGYASIKASGAKTPIMYLESPLESHKEWVGYDLSSDTLLKDAMEYARDSNKTVLSRSTSSLQTADNIQKHSIMFTPVYRNSEPIDTPEQRRSAITGYTFIVVDTASLLHPLAASLMSIDLTVYDGVEATTESLLYKNTLIDDIAPSVSDMHTLLVANRPWTIFYASQPGLEPSRTARLMPSIILIGGSALYFFLLAIIYYLISHGYVLHRQKHARHFDF